MSVMKHRGIAMLIVLTVVGSVLLVPSPKSAGALDPGGYTVPTEVLAGGTATTGAGVTLCVASGACVVVAAAVAAIGIGVGTNRFFSWLDPGDDPPGVEESIGLSSTGPVDCPPYVSSSGNACIRVAAAALPSINPGWGCCNVDGFAIIPSIGTSSPAFPSKQVGFFRLPGDPTYYGDSSTGAFPSASVGNLFAWFIPNAAQQTTPTKGCLPGLTAQFRAYYTQFTGTTSSPNVFGAVRMCPQADASGLQRRLVADRVCFRNGVSSFVQQIGPVYWDDAAEQQALPKAECPPGWFSTLWRVIRRTIGGPDYSPAIPDKELFTWTMPAEGSQVKCLANAATCELETVPETPTEPEKCLWGGQEVPLSYCENTTRIQLLEPSPTTTSSPTTTVVTSTSAVTSTSTTSTSVPTTAVPPTPPQTPGDPPESTTFGTCLDERLEGFGGEFSLTNPGSWIRTTIAFIVAPVFCALYWFFVPAGGWAAALLPFQELWNNNATLGPLRNLFSLGASSSCAPYRLEGQFFGPGGIDIDAGLCGNGIILSIWYVLLGLAAVGMVWDLFGSVSEYRSKHAASDGDA